MAEGGRGEARGGRQGRLVQGLVVAAGGGAGGRLVRGVFADHQGQGFRLVCGTRHLHVAKGVQGIRNDDIAKALQALVGGVEVAQTRHILKGGGTTKLTPLVRLAGPFLLLSACGL